MRKLVSIFIGIGGVGITAAILSIVKWGILHFDRLYLLFSLSINGLLIIVGFFGSWVIKTFDDYRISSREYKKCYDEKVDDLEKDMASISNRLMSVEGIVIDLNNKKPGKRNRGRLKNGNHKSSKKD